MALRYARKTRPYRFGRACTQDDAPMVNRLWTVDYGLSSMDYGLWTIDLKPQPTVLSYLSPMLLSPDCRHILSERKELITDRDTIVSFCHMAERFLEGV
jgi:hypothetical protein